MSKFMFSVDKTYFNKKLFKLLASHMTLEGRRLTYYEEILHHSE